MSYAQDLCPQVTWSGYVVWPGSQGTEPSACAREGQVPGRPKANAEEAHRTQSALDANYQDSRARH